LFEGLIAQQNINMQPTVEEPQDNATPDVTPATTLALVTEEVKELEKQQQLRQTSNKLEGKKRKKEASHTMLRRNRSQNSHSHHQSKCKGRVTLARRFRG
jgi:hypothetical protein